jgi:ribose 5-phosphate isomerase A
MASDQEKNWPPARACNLCATATLVGLGSGSTAAYAVRFLGERVRAGLKIRGISTSVQKPGI